VSLGHREGNVSEQVRPWGLVDRGKTEKKKSATGTFELKKKKPKERDHKTRRRGNPLSAGGRKPRGVKKKDRGGVQGTLGVARKSTPGEWEKLYPDPQDETGQTVFKQCGVQPRRVERRREKKKAKPRKRKKSRRVAKPAYGTSTSLLRTLKKKEGNIKTWQRSRPGKTE